MTRNLLRPVALPLLLAAVACDSAPPAVANTPHTHQHTTMVTVTDSSVLPSPTVKIPLLSTVVWRNRATAPVQIEVIAASCGGCDTVLGFTPGTTGARTAAVSPGAIASLCFHYAGSYPFVARTGNTELRGSIEVGGEP